MGLGSGFRKEPISDPGSGSRGQKGTGSRIRNTERIPKKAPKIKVAEYIVYKIVLCKIVYTESHKTHNKRIKFCSGFD